MKKILETIIVSTETTSLSPLYDDISVKCTRVSRTEQAKVSVIIARILEGAILESDAKTLQYIIDDYAQNQRIQWFRYANCHCLMHNFHSR